MPPKESTKPTSKPSSRGQYSKHRPQLFGKSLDADELDLIFFAYNRYFYERRPLLREEACGIIGVCFGKEPRITDVKDLLDAFDKPENALTRELQGSTDGKVEGLEKVVKTCFNKYLEKDAEAQARAEYLRGLTQRLATTNWKAQPKWHGAKIWPYKFFPLYIIANYCEEADVLEAAIEGFFDGIGSKSYAIMQKLAQKDSPEAIDIAKLIMVDLGFFLRRTQVVLDEKMGVRAPRLKIPPEYRDDTVTSTTRAFEATTLGATASSQPQRTARTGYPPVAPSTYQPPSTGSDEPITGDLHHPTGPGSSRSSNPGPYRNVFTDSAQRRRRDPANPGNIQGSSRESGEEDEDEGEDEGKEEGRREKSKAQGKEKEEKKGKEKGKGNDKRKGSGTPEAPPPRKLPYDPTKDRD